VRDQIRAALQVAEAEPVLIVRGDLATDLPALLAEAPRDVTLVVLHTAVLMYVDDRNRAPFADAVRSSRAVWLANEAPERIPGLDPASVGRHPDGMFLLRRDGRPLARTDPHGSRIDWL